MYFAEKEIISPIDFDSRQVREIVSRISALKSDCYFIMNDRTVNAKSIIGILSAGIKRKTPFLIKVTAGSQEQADEDLRAVCGIITAVYDGLQES